MASTDSHHQTVSADDLVEDHIKAGDDQQEEEKVEIEYDHAEETAAYDHQQQQQPHSSDNDHLGAPQNQLNATFSEQPLEQHGNPLDEIRDEVQSPSAHAVGTANEFFVLLDYYHHQHLPAHAQQLCQHASTQFGTSERVTHLWSSILTGLYCNSSDQKSLNTAIQQCEHYSSDEDYALVALSAILHFHKLLGTPNDTPSIVQYRDLLKQYSKTDNDQTLLTAARFFIYTNKLKQLRQCLEKVLQRNKKHAEALVLFAQLQLLMGMEETSNQEAVAKYNKKANECLSTVIKHSTPDTDISALLHRSTYYVLVGKYNKALDDINSIISQYGEYMQNDNEYTSIVNVALAEKCRIQALNNQWEDALNTAQRLLQRHGYNVVGNLVTVLYTLTHNTQSHPIQQCVQSLFEAIQQSEPTNHELWSTVTQLLLRYNYPAISTTIQPYIQHTIQLILQLQPHNSQYLTLHGQYYIQLHNFVEADKLYKHAQQLDDTNLYAIYGQIQCLIGQQKFDYAEDLCEQLVGIVQSEGDNHSESSSELLYLQAVLAAQKQSSTDALKYTQLALQQYQLSLTSALATGIQSNNPFYYFIALDPQHAAVVLSTLLQHMCSIGLDNSPARVNNVTEATMQATLQPGTYSQATQLSHTLQQLYPAHPHLTFIHASLYYYTQQYTPCEQLLAAAIQNETNNSAYYMLYAQVHISRSNYKAASQCMEIARSIHYEVRHTVLYHTMKAQLLVASQQSEDALKVLLSAIELPGVKPNSQPLQSKKHLRSSSQTVFAHTNSLPLQHRINVYVELARVYMLLNQFNDAQAVINDLKQTFTSNRYDSTVQDQLQLAQAEQHCSLHDYPKAIEALSAVSTTSSIYTIANIQRADIYLQQQKNARLYIQCYEQLHTQYNTLQSQLMLANAYKHVGSNEKAIATYEQALALQQQSPAEIKTSSVDIGSCIGQLLVQSHDYAKAVNYYERSLQANRTNIPLYHDLAQLYIHLKHYDEAIETLTTAIQVTSELNLHTSTNTNSNTNTQRDEKLTVHDIQSYTLLSEVYLALNEYNQMLSALQNALEYQRTLLTNQQSTPETLTKQYKQTASTLCYKLAVYYRTYVGDESSVISYADEALKYDDSNIKVHLLLAQVYVSSGAIQQCHEHCSAILQLNPSHTEANAMLADLLFTQNQTDAAISQYEALVSNTNTAVALQSLSALIQLLRRAGRLNDATQYIDAVNKNVPPASPQAPYLAYCRALYHMYVSDVQKALQQFNIARKSPDVGKQAIQYMIQVYLHLEQYDWYKSITAADDNTRLQSAESLLRELEASMASTVGSDRHMLVVIQSYVSFASKNKSRIDSALDRLTQQLNDVKDHIPSLVAQAYGHLCRNEAAKAKSVLKRVGKAKSVDVAYANEMEHAWLLLADMYAAEKPDMTSELCKRVIAQNKAATRAYEMLGAVYERASKHEEAAECYEVAWKYIGATSASAAVGYKLAFNYLKSKRYVEACDVCHKVLTADPQYPKIRREILAKARENLRP